MVVERVHEAEAGEKVKAEEVWARRLVGCDSLVGSEVGEIVAEVKARVAVAMVAEETVEAVAMGQAAQVEDRMAARVEGAREVEVMDMATRVEGMGEALQEVAWMVVVAAVDVEAVVAVVAVMVAA